MYCDYHHDCNVMKKHCCRCSLKLDVGIQTDFPDKQTNNYKDIDPNILIDLFRKYYSDWYNGRQSIAEAEAILGELRRVGSKTCEQYDIFLGNCLVN